MKDFIEGEILLLDKPFRWTSFDLVKKVKNLVQNKYRIKDLKVGHAGTLDPLATGLVVICTGKKTKTIDSLQIQDKEYIATIQIGSTTPSFDLETQIDGHFPVEHINTEILLAAIQKFSGIQMQTPPLYSAKQIDGKRAYEHARKGNNIELKAVEINIKEIELVSDMSEFPTIRLRILCSKGSYIRSIASDLGKTLNSGAHLAGLIRTKSGEFLLSAAQSIESFEKSLSLEV